MDIHNYGKRLDRTLNNIHKSDILPDNKKLILGFHDHCFTEGLSLSKIERYLFDLHKFALLLCKNLTAATKQDIQRIVAEIEKKEWSPHTKHAFKVMIRKFYKWQEGIDENGVYPEKVKWLHSNVKNNLTKLPDSLLTDEEIMTLIQHAKGVRDRALIAMLSESGCRISELGLIMIRNVSADDYGIKVSVAGKTGPRRIMLISSAPFLQEWLNKHPDNKNPESFVWVNSQGKLLSYTRLVAIIKDAAIRAGIRKRVYPHLFRHSRATYLAKFLTEAQMKEYLGWTQSSKMAAVYVHLSGRDTDQAILKLHGIRVSEDKTKDELSSKTCRRCSSTNQFTNVFCFKCGMVLDEKESQKILSQDLKRGEADRMMNELMKDEEFVSMMFRKLKEKAALPQPAPA